MAGRLDHVVIAVEAAGSVDEDLVAAVGALVPQLSSSSPAPSKEALRRIVADPGATLFVARDDDRVVGMLTLVTFEIPTAVRAWIEDVVVDHTARGKGVAAALVQAAIDGAAARGARTVDLTSRPDREEANRLYVRMGFEARVTNVYRRTLDA
ncbi:MAG TPA: GNAT family N-acetyltransferase [Acidimicrobiales bacterium]|nr:GNAT family N-acetyltransferase [Acidimicrobiales bacterium]